MGPILTGRIFVSGVLLFDAMNDIAVPEDHISRVDLRHRYHRLIELKVRMRRGVGARTDERLVERVDSMELRVRDV